MAPDELTEQRLGRFTGCRCSSCRTVRGTGYAIGFGCILGSLVTGLTFPLGFPLIEERGFSGTTLDFGQSQFVGCTEELVDFVLFAGFTGRVVQAIVTLDRKSVV